MIGIIVSLLILAVGSIIVFKILQLIPVALVPSPIKQILFYILGFFIFLEVLAILGLLPGVPHYRVMY